MQENIRVKSLFLIKCGLEAQVFFCEIAKLLRTYIEEDQEARVLINLGFGENVSAAFI